MIAHHENSRPCGVVVFGVLSFSCLSLKLTMHHAVGCCIGVLFLSCASLSISERTLGFPSNLWESEQGTPLGLRFGKKISPFLLRLIVNAKPPRPDIFHWVHCCGVCYDRGATFSQAFSDQVANYVLSTIVSFCFCTVLVNFYTYYKLTVGTFVGFPPFVCSRPGFG